MSIGRSHAQVAIDPLRRDPEKRGLNWGGLPPSGPEADRSQPKSGPHPHILRRNTGLRRRAHRTSRGAILVHRAQPLAELRSGHKRRAGLASPPRVCLVIKRGEPHANRVVVLGDRLGTLSSGSQSASTVPRLLSAHDCGRLRNSIAISRARSLSPGANSPSITNSRR